MHFRLNLQSVGDCGRSGGMNAGRICDDELVEGVIGGAGAATGAGTGVGATIAGAGATGACPGGTTTVGPVGPGVAATNNFEMSNFR